jgi:cytochrome c oxidase cbb3-type subunit 3
MFKAADLGRDDWQSKVSDQEIAATITNGKGRMPKFELPDEVVKGLVVRVRSFRGQ